MTTIAIHDGLLATDTQATISTTCSSSGEELQWTERVLKCRKTPLYFFCGTGDMNLVRKLKNMGSIMLMKNFSSFWISSGDTRGVINAKTGNFSTIILIWRNLTVE